MPFEEKVGVTVMLALLAVGSIFVNTSGRWQFHAINPFRILLAHEDGTLRPWAKPLIWVLAGIGIACIWLVAETTESGM